MTPCFEDEVISPEKSRPTFLYGRPVQKKPTMIFKDAYQQGFFSIFCATGRDPLNLWDTHVSNGCIRRILDPDLKQFVLEVRGRNVSTTYITCPKNNDHLGIIMPFLVMVVKNLKQYFSFEVAIRDHNYLRRRFRVSNFQSSTTITPTATVMPICLADGWNQIQFNLAEFTRKAYNNHFMEVLTVKINCNVHIRHIYFARCLVPEEELPKQFRLYYPLSKKQSIAKEAAEEDKENDPTNEQEEIGEESTEPPGPQVSAKEVQSQTKSLRSVQSETKSQSKMQQSVASVKSKTKSVGSVKSATKSATAPVKSKSATRSVGSVKSATKSVGSVKSGTKSAGEVKSGTQSVGAVKSGTQSVGAVKSGTQSAGQVKSTTQLLGEVKSTTKSAGSVKSQSKSVEEIKAAPKSAGAVESTIMPPENVESETKLAEEAESAAKSEDAVEGDEPQQGSPEEELDQEPDQELTEEPTQEPTQEPEEEQVE